MKYSREYNAIRREVKVERGDDAVEILKRFADLHQEVIDLLGDVEVKEEFEEERDRFMFICGKLLKVNRYLHKAMIELEAISRFEKKFLKGKTMPTELKDTLKKLIGEELRYIR